MVIGDGGAIQGSTIYRARVRNQAKHAYNSVATWLENKGSMPAAKLRPVSWLSYGMVRFMIGIAGYAPGIKPGQVK